MPTTTTFAIPYPCETDLITSASMAAYANGVEAALVTTDAAGTKARLRPAAVAKSSLQSYVAGTPLVMSYSLVAANIDNMFSLAAPTVFTVNTAGSYLVTAIAIANIATTNTSFRCEILLNGAVVSTGKSGPGIAAAQPPNPMFAQVFLPQLLVGNTLSSRITVTGVGNDIAAVTLSASLITFGGS
jgi:hypothetical protein